MISILSAFRSLEMVFLCCVSVILECEVDGAGRYVKRLSRVVLVMIEALTVGMVPASRVR